MMKTPEFGEDLLHYLWRVRAFDQSNLLSSDERPIRIFNIGEYNRDAGPDFLNARLQIGEVHWFGQVEIHIQSSDWDLHQHSGDPAYENVILHVVYRHDREIYRADGSRIPVLELRERIDPGRLVRYKELMSRLDRILCKPFLDKLEAFRLSEWKTRMGIERLESKCKRIERGLKRLGGDWEQLFFQQLAGYTGQRVNAEAFRLAAERTPVAILLKHRNRNEVVPAILFGNAGMLDRDFRDEYPRKLQQNFKYFKRMYRWSDPPAIQWKFMRMRPDNFPTIRMAQLAALIEHHGRLFSALLSASGLEEIYRMLDVEAAAYWNDHYLFDKAAGKSRPKKPGAQAKDIIIINAVVPFRYLYGKRTGRPDLCDQAIDLLHGIDAENNRIIRQWKEARMTVGNAFDSQALLHLYQNYCKERRCMQCRIGHQIISR